MTTTRAGNGSITARSVLAFLARHQHVLMSVLVVVLAWALPLQILLYGFGWTRGGGQVVHALPSNWAAVEDTALMLMTIVATVCAVAVTVIVISAAVRRRLPAAMRPAGLTVTFEAVWSLAVVVTVAVVRNVLQMTP